jgi:hypothetical protein
MSILSKIFGGGGQKSNPMGDANQFLNQIPGVAHQGYDPYVNTGLDATNKTKWQYESLMNDPIAFINKLMEGYKPSEGYNFQKDQLTKEMGNTAAAGGIAGTPLDQMNQAEGIQGLLSKDMQQFLQNVLGVFNTGLGGEEGIAGRGFDASKYLTDALGGALNQQGGLAFQNAQQNNSDKNSWYKGLAKALGAGAGAVFGGVPGAKVGSSIFG